MNSNPVLTIFVIVTAIAFCVQVLLLYVLYKAIDKSSARMENIANRMEERTTPVLATARAILEEVQPKIGEITDNLAEASATVRANVANLAEATGEIAERARMQAAHLDHLIQSTAERVSETTEFLQEKVITPVRRVQAIVSAASAAVGFLKRSRAQHKGPQLAATHEDEMFI